MADIAVIEHTFGIAVPDDVDDVTRLVREHIAIGRRSALLIALLIAHGRDTCFADDPSAWLTWARDEFGYQRRFCFQCLKAGRLLLATAGDKCINDALARCDLVKLELLARIPAPQLPAFVGHVDVAGMTREQLRDKIAALYPENDDDEEKAKATRPPRRTKTAAEKLDDWCVEVAGYTHDTKLELLPTLDPMSCFVAGRQLLDLALAKLATDKTWSEEQYDFQAKGLGAITKAFAALHQQAKLPEPQADQ